MSGTKRDVALAKLQLAVRASKEVNGKITVEDAAEVLNISSRRVRALIKPECNCVLRKRRAKAEPIPDINCPECNGSGHGSPRMHAIYLKGHYWIPEAEVLKFLDTRKTGRPSIPILAD